MNKKNYIKIGILLVLGLSVFGGCSARREGTYTREELDNLAEIRIYSAENDELIKTISDEEQLYQYNQCSPRDASYMEERQDEWKKAIKDAKAQYSFVSYKYPVARFGKKEPEENTTITLYEDKNIIKMKASGESLKAISLPENFLVFYYELSDEEMNFYHSLLE